MAEGQDNADSSTQQPDGAGKAQTDAQNAADQKGADKRQGSSGSDAGSAGNAADGATSDGKARADGKTGDDGKADADGKADGSDKPKPPEKYDLKLSEGSVLESDVVDQIAAIAREQGWSQEEATERLAAVEAKAMEERNARVAKWEAAINADQDLGGKNLKQTNANLDRFMNKFAPKGTPDGDAFREVLHRTGYGSHPAVVRIASRIGAAMAEDKQQGGDGGKPKPKPPELKEQLYGKTTRGADA